MPISVEVDCQGTGAEDFSSLATQRLVYCQHALAAVEAEV